MPNIIDIPTGHVEVAKGDALLEVIAMGSCVCVCAYCLKNKVGGAAHVMLPGSAPEGRDLKEKTKYAADAIGEMLSRMVSLGADIKGIEACLIGGANVLKREGDMIAKNNIDSVVTILREKEIIIKAQAVGGITRRRVLFDIEKGNIIYGEGDEENRLLWAVGKSI